MTTIGHPSTDAPPAASSASADRGSDPEPLRLIAIVFHESDDPSCWTGPMWRGALPGDSALEAIADATSAVARWPGLIDTPAEATVALLSDAEAADLNARFRGINKPTNVLSFPTADHTAFNMAADPSGDRVSIGDIALAEGTILREAAELGIDPSDHLRHLLVHGLLHLLGYDHMAEDDALRMEALETAILASIDIADPYAGTDAIGPGLTKT